MRRLQKSCNSSQLKKVTFAGVAARRADDIASGAATVDAINRRRAAAPDSDVVARYKAGQAKVIADASK